jgi:hypothetical protein
VLTAAFLLHVGGLRIAGQRVVIAVAARADAQKEEFKPPPAHSSTMRLPGICSARAERLNSGGAASNLGRRRLLLLIKGDFMSESHVSCSCDMYLRNLKQDIGFMC